MFSFKFITQETLSDGRMYAYTILNSFYTNAVVTSIFSSFLWKKRVKEVKVSKAHGSYSAALRADGPRLKLPRGSLWS